MAISVLTPTAVFFDNSGNLLNGGTVTVEDALTTDLRNIYTDTALSVSATNPMPLDSAGRPTQGMVYTAAGAYKLIIKDSDGVTLYTRDSVDSGVPVGTGALAIANGGTGATSAAAAVAALGAATAAEVADIAADLASLAGTLDSTEATHVATGTTAQRSATPIEGDIRRNTTTSKYEFYTGAAWINFVLTDDVLAGSVVKSTLATYVANADLTTVIPNDDTIPQNTEGTQIISQAFTPTSATNLLRFRFSGIASVGASSKALIAALFQDSTASAIAASAHTNAAADDMVPITFMHQQVAGSTSALTFAVRVGASVGTMRMNGITTARRYGGVTATTLLIEEIKV